MSLTGPLLFVLVLALTVTAFGAVIWSWPRWAGPHWRQWIARGGLLTGVNALVLLLAAVGLNDQFGFFADWTDLAGALSSAPPPSASHSGGDAGAATRAKVGGGLVAPPVVPAFPLSAVSRDGVAHVQVSGPLSGLRGEVDVTLPVGYNDPRQRQRRYPVIEAFEGYPGQPFNPRLSLRHAVQAGLLSDAIIISPNSEIPAGRDTECVDGGPGEPKIETWLTEDIPNWAARTLRVKPERSSWATIGMSAGGWCAAMAAMLHPDRYAAAIVLGGYFQPDFGSLFRPFTPTSPLGRRYDLVALAAHAPPPIALWMQTSQADSLSYPTSRQLIQRARPPLSVQSLVLRHAGHRIGLWAGLLPETMAWLGATVPGFDPTAQPTTGPGLPTPEQRPSSGPGLPGATRSGSVSTASGGAGPRHLPGRRSLASLG